MKHLDGQMFKLLCIGWFIGLFLSIAIVTTVYYLHNNYEQELINEE